MARDQAPIDLATLHVPILPGMRQDLSPMLAPVGTITRAKNVRFDVSGEVESRPGVTPLSAETDASIPYKQIVAGAGPDFLTPCPGGFYFGTKGCGYRYDFAKARVQVAGSYSHAIPQRRFAVIASEEVPSTDFVSDSNPWPLSCAVGGGYVAICWSLGNGAQNVGKSSGAVVKVQFYTTAGARVTTWEAGGFCAACVLWDPVNSEFMIVAQGTGSTQLHAARCAAGANGITVGAFVALPGGVLASVTSCWAACTWPGVGWGLAFQRNGTELLLARLNGTTINASIAKTTAAGPDKPVSIFCDAVNFYVGWVETGAGNIAKAAIYTIALVDAGGGTATIWNDGIAGPLAMTPPLFCQAATGAGKAFVIVGRSGSIVSDFSKTTYVRAFYLTSLGAVTAAAPTYGAVNMFPVSSPFAGGLVWCRVRAANGQEWSNNHVRHVLLDFQADRLQVGDDGWNLKLPKVALAGDAYADPEGGAYAGGYAFLHYHNPQQLPSGEWLMGLPTMARAVAPPAGLAESGLALGEWVRYSIAARRQCVAFGDEAIVAGSPVLVGDAVELGTRIYADPLLAEPVLADQNLGADLGFFSEPSLHFPDYSDTPSGGLTIGAHYLYRAVWEWIDGRGRRWRSRVSHVLPVHMLGVTDTLTFASGDGSDWLRQDAYLVAGMSGVRKHYYRTVDGGDAFYRVTPPQGAPSAGGTFVDIVDDGALSLNERLYTDGGVLDNDHAPSCRYVAVTEDRVWFGGLWDPRRIQSSKIVVPGEPVQCSDSPAFQVILPADNTGLAVQDGVVIIFTASAIFTISGLGPTDQGQGAWDSPRVITRSTGCVNAASILETSAGIFFQSRRGIELLPRGAGEPIFIGAGVQNLMAELGSSGVVAAAVISGATRTARFCIGGPYVMLFDLDAGAWSFDEYPAAVAGICDTERGAVLALANASNGFGFLLETDAAATDTIGAGPATEIASEVSFAQVRPFGIAGFGRLANATAGLDAKPGGYRAAGQLTLIAEPDYPEAFADAGATFPMVALLSPDYRQHVPESFNGTAFSLRLTTTAAGWRFIGWTLEVMPHPGARRMGDGQRG